MQVSLKQQFIVYIFCFSEENVYKLAEEVIAKHPNEINKCFVVFVSNPSRTVPLWRQRAGKDEDKLVIWVSYYFFDESYSYISYINIQSNLL